MNNYNILNIAIGAFGFLIMQVSEFWTNLDPATKFISWILGAVLLIISIITNLISLRMVFVIQVHSECGVDGGEIEGGRWGCVATLVTGCNCKDSKTASNLNLCSRKLKTN